MRSFIRTILFLSSTYILSGFFSPAQLQATIVFEWSIVSPTLESRTTTALLRYYTVIEADSLKLRYIRRKAGRSLYQVRAQFKDNDSDSGSILFVSIGQLRIFPTDAIRIALGENLYQELLYSKNEPTNHRTRIDLGSSFDHQDWTGNHRVAWSLWDRLDVGIADEINGFVALGAPESNLDFWMDGTGRVGIATPLLEFSFLFPFSSGSVEVGPLPQRLLVPGYGASALLRYNTWTGRIRFSDATNKTVNSTSSIDRNFVHSLSSALYGEKDFQTTFGSFLLTGGIGLEEFTELKLRKGELERAGYVRRVSPITHITYTTTDENFRLSTGVTDLALRSTATVRLSSNIWLEARAVNTSFFRDHKVFEHSFAFFFTPRIKF